MGYLRLGLTKVIGKGTATIDILATGGRYRNNTHLPWLSDTIMAALFYELMQQLDVISKRPLSFEEFHHAVCGASEHDIHRAGRSGRRINHLLSTMARFVTVTLRLREEGNPAWEASLSKILACAWRVVNQKPQGQCAQQIRTLYDFMSIRCDDAAVRILSDRAILAHSPPWTVLSSVEHAVTLCMLNLIDDKIQLDCVCIKDKLGCY